MNKSDFLLKGAGEITSSGWKEILALDDGIILVQEKLKMFFNVELWSLPGGSKAEDGHKKLVVKFSELDYPEKNLEYLNVEIHEGMGYFKAGVKNPLNNTVIDFSDPWE